MRKITITLDQDEFASILTAIYTTKQHYSDCLKRVEENEERADYWKREIKIMENLRETLLK